MLVKGPGQLEAAREPQVGALVSGEAVEGLAVEAHGARLVLQGAANAVDEGAFARAVGADQAEALALGHVEVDAFEGDEAAEALGQAFDLEQGGGHAGTGRPLGCGPGCEL
jgi:hypothetical protein